jgi:hypothetical protein
VVVHDGDGEWSDGLRALAARGLIGVAEGGGLAAALAAQDRARAAVILAPDALVGPGWFDRLAAHLREGVATVTALSSHAAFAAYPRGGEVNLVACAAAGPEVDRVAAAVNAGHAVAAPGAGGACVLIAPAALDLVPPGAPDAAAAAGAAAWRAGATNLVACDVFVPRAGGHVPRSPAPPVAADAAQAAAVRAHLRAGPVQAARRRIDLARLSAAGPVPVLHLTHAMGGGVETWLAPALRRIPGSAVLRLHEGHRATVETCTRRGVFVPNLAGLDLRGDAGLLPAILAALAPRRIVLHSLSGLAWPMQAAVLDLLAAARAEVEAIVHDYAAVSAQYCLVPPDGGPFAGLPDMERLTAWAAMADPLAGAGQGDPAARQAAYGAVLARAARRVCPSAAAAAVMRHYFPALSFEVEPHAPHLPPPAPLPPRRPDGRLRIAVPGKLWPHKGSAVVEALAEAARAASLPIDISVVGHSDIDDRLRALGVRITGAYRREAEALHHLARLAPDLLFVPSLWPETFCYTLSFAPALGLRAAVFDLGAQAERARAMPGAAVLPLALARDPAGLAAALMALRPAAAAAASA